LLDSIHVKQMDVYVPRFTYSNAGIFPYLLQRPGHDDDVARPEEAVGHHHFPSLRDRGQALGPRIARRYAEHGQPGKGKLAETLLVVPSEESDAHDGVDAHDHQQDEVGVEDGDNGAAEGLDNAVERFDLADHADDAECSYRAQHNDVDLPARYESV
jgi:hypothetical protein